MGAPPRPAHPLHAQHPRQRALLRAGLGRLHRINSWRREEGRGRGWGESFSGTVLWALVAAPSGSGSSGVALVVGEGGRSMKVARLGASCEDSLTLALWLCGRASQPGTAAVGQQQQQSGIRGHKKDRASWAGQGCQGTPRDTGGTRRTRAVCIYYVAELGGKAEGVAVDALQQAAAHSKGDRLQPVGQTVAGVSGGHATGGTSHCSHCRVPMECCFLGWPFLGWPTLGSAAP